MAVLEADPVSVPGTLQQFNRYGLPGLVIGVLLLIIIAFVYFDHTTLMDVIKSESDIIQADTKAKIEMTGALDRLTQTIGWRR